VHKCLAGEFMGQIPATFEAGGGEPESGSHMRERRKNRALPRIFWIDLKTFIGNMLCDLRGIA